MKTFTNAHEFNFLRCCTKVVCLLLGLGLSGASWGQQVKNTTRNTTFSTIQAAINDAATVAGDIIEVGAGTYNEFVTVDKAITIQGVSTDAIIKVPYSGSADGVLITTGNVTLRNLTITRDYGTTVEEWYACGVNQGINFNSRPNVRLEGLIVKGNRNGIYCNNSQNATIINCLIEDNRTGVHFANNVSGLIMTNNIVRNNFTHGVLFNFDSGVLSATNARVNNNSITGNWYSQVNFQRGLAADPTNIGDLTGLSFGCNWYGAASPTINAVGAGEPGYAAQQPSQFGGTNPNASATDRYFMGAHAASIPFSPALEDGTDTKTDIGFQPVGNTCTPVINANRNTYFATIQAAINDASTLAGDTLTLISGVYNEQVLVNKGVVIKGIGATKPEINFTGTPSLASTRLTAFEVTAANVTIEGLKFKVDLTKIGSAILASAANINNLTVKNNDFIPYRSAAYGPGYGLRNAISINYGTYRVNASNPSGLLIKDNVVTYDKGADSTNLTSDDTGFRAGVSIDEGGGVITGNTLQAISQDVEVRFASSGDVTVSNNTLKGGGSEISEHNAGAGTITIKGNTFNGAFGNTYSNLLRLKNNQANKTTIVSKNTFNNVIWGVSMENYKAVTLDSNSFTPKSGATAYQLVTVNTKLNSSSSAAVDQTAIGATFTNNEFNGSGATGGKALSFFNQDSDNDTYRTFTIGTSGNENVFNAGIKDFIYLDNSTGSSNGYVFPDIAGLPNYPTTGSWPTTMAPWAENLNVRYNKFDVGTGLKSPMVMDFAERTAFESALTHKPDNAALGQISYFNPVHNLTQDTYFASIQPAITAAAAGDTLELSEWTFAEGITIDKSLTIQGVDSANVILDGSTIADANGITLGNNVQNITIKKLTIKKFKGSGSAGSGIYGLGNSNLTIDEVVLDGNQGRGGIYLGGGGGIENVTIKNSISKNHAVAASRGIVIWDGFKKNITITNNKVYNNNCCGIELQDGTASGVTITGNLVIGNVDNGLGLTGLTGGAGANLISNNTVINNGRFGIEIKNPNGTGLSTGDGSVLVKGNTVSFSASGSMNNRDHAGISVYRRAFLVNNTENYSNIPTGVVVDSNTVSGFKHMNSTESKGYGIVVEGTNHTVRKNTISNSDIGIQEQGGLHPNAGYVTDNAGDADQADTKSLNYFGRGNSPVACGNTFSNNIYSTNTTDMNSVVGSNSFALVVNKRNRETFCSIQAAISDANTMNGDTLNVSSGIFNEQVLVNKSLLIRGIGVTKPEINFTGTPALASTRLTAFEVTAANVTIEGLKFKVDLTKIGSAILASAANINNLTVKNNDFIPYRSAAYGPGYGLRNAISINYGTYRVNASNPSGLLIKDNVVTYDKGADSTNLTSDDTGFRAGVSIDEGGGVITGNTLQAISQDVEVRFASSGDVTVSNNIMKGGGSEISEHNAGAGTITIKGNTFNGAFGNTYSNLLRLKNNQANKTTIVSKNTFNNVIWGVSMENYKAVTLDSNTFTPKSGATAYQLVTVNTKLNSSSSAGVDQTAISATLTNNEFNGSGATGGKALSFFNQDSDNDTYGTFTIGTSGNENIFNAGIKDFIYLDNSTGSSNGYVFPGIAGLPNYPTTGSWPTTMAPWAENLNVRYNKFDVGTGLKSPMVMDFAERTAFESALTHKPDNSALGQISYFNPVHNLTQDTYFASIQPAITAAAAGDTLELSEWTFAEGITIDKSLTIQGVDSANVVLDGSTIADANGITLANNVKNITIKKLTIKKFKGSGSAGSGIYGLGNSNLTIDEVVLDGNQGRGGIYLGGGGGIENVTIKNSISKNHAVAASRGIVIWDGFKKNITITNNKVYNNNCCGIELQDGTASGVTITGNLVIGNVDSGLGLTGLTGGAGANLISNNTVINNGRFGIEIKNPNGTGLSTGDGSVLVKGNTVSLAASGSMNNRDHAGISVYRRAFLVNNTENYSNIPTGVVVDSNTVTGFRHLNSSESKGYGIVVEGTNHTVKRNTVGNNDFGIHEQGGLHPNANYVADNAGDADQADTKSLNYFGRGNSPVACGNTFIDNTFNANLVTNMNTAVGSNSFALVVNKRNKETFCSIQAAIDDSNTMNGDTIVVSAGTYLENITVNKSLALQGPNATINPNTGTRVEEAIIRPAVRQTSLEGSTSGTIIRVGGMGHIDVSIKGFKLDGNNPALTGGRRLNSVNIHTGAGIVNSIGSFDTNPGGADATMVIQNNIIQNVERYGVLADGTTPAKAIAGTNVSYNKFDNIPSGDNFGGGRGRAAAFEENHYGTFVYNVVTRANVGWQDDNYYLASPGAGTIVEHNNIKTYRRGIFHNLQYQNATAARIANNTITKETSGDFAAHTENFGVELSSIQSTVSVAADSNDVSGMKYGILLWNIPSTGTVKVSKGTLTGNQYGIYATSNDPQFAAGSASNSIISGVKVVNSTSAGITVDNASNYAATAITLTDSTVISGGPKGLVLTGANTTISGGTLNNTHFTGQTGNYIELVNSTGNMDGGNATFGTKKAIAMTQVERTALEGKLLHKPDNAALGKVCLPSVATFAIKSGSPSTYCNGSSTILVATIISATGPSTLIYTDGTTQTTVNNYVSGTDIPVSPTTTKRYSIVSIGDASGCTTSTGFTDTLTVIVNPIPTKPTITPAAIAICQGSSTTLTASACAGGTLAWTGGLTGTSISVTTTSSYKVACTQLGCTSDSSDVSTVTVNPIPAKPTITPSSTAICVGSSTTLTASACAGGNLLWTGGLTGTSITVSPTATKSYRVTCTQLNCTSDLSDEAIITVNPIPIRPVISSNFSSICSGESAILSVTSCGGGTVKWTGGLSGSSISVSPTATKSYKAACTQLDCTSDSSFVVTITVKATPAAPTVTADNSTICNGQTVILTGSCPTGNFAWVVTGTSGVVADGPLNNRTITAPGTYSATCTNNGCVSAEGSVTITSGSCRFLTISPSNPTICPGKSITLTTSGCNAGNITWAGGATGAGTSITVSPTATTTYLATCSSGGSATVTVNVAESNVSVTNNVSTGVVLVKAAQAIESNKKVGNPAFTPMPNVIYQAGSSVVLNPGFVVESGAVFKAEIQVCN